MAQENTIALLLDGIRSKCSIGSKRSAGDDLTLSFFSGIEADCNLLATEINTEFQNSDQSYNELADAFENLQLKASMMESRLADVDHELALGDNKVIDAIAEVQRLLEDERRKANDAILRQIEETKRVEAIVVVLQQRENDLMANARKLGNEVKTLRAMEPERL